jgi:hypothetical protein
MRISAAPSKCPAASTSTAKSTLNPTRPEALGEEHVAPKERRAGSASPPDAEQQARPTGVAEHAHQASVVDDQGARGHATVVQPATESGRASGVESQVRVQAGFARLSRLDPHDGERDGRLHPIMDDQAKLGGGDGPSLRDGELAEPDLVPAVAGLAPSRCRAEHATLGVPDPDLCPDRCPVGAVAGLFQRLRAGDPGARSQDIDEERRRGPRDRVERHTARRVGRAHAGLGRRAVEIHRAPPAGRPGCEVRVLERDDDGRDSQAIARHDLDAGAGESHGLSGLGREPERRVDRGDAVFEGLHLDEARIAAVVQPLDPNGTEVVRCVRDELQRVAGDLVGHEVNLGERAGGRAAPPRRGRPPGSPRTSIANTAIGAPAASVAVTAPPGPLQTSTSEVHP